MDLLGKRLKPYGRVYEVAQNEFCRIRLTVEEKLQRFIKKRLGERRIAFYTRDYRLFKISS